MFVLLVEVPKNIKAPKGNSSRLLKILCDPDWIRTNDLLLRRQLLYPTELPDHLFKKTSKLFEPMTFPTMVGMLYPTELPDHLFKKTSKLFEPMTFPTMVGMLYPTELPDLRFWTGAKITCCLYGAKSNRGIVVEYFTLVPHPPPKYSLITKFILCSFICPHDSYRNDSSFQPSVPACIFLLTIKSAL